MQTIIKKLINRFGYDLVPIGRGVPLRSPNPTTQETPSSDNIAGESKIPKPKKDRKSRVAKEVLEPINKVESIEDLLKPFNPIFHPKEYLGEYILAKRFIFVLELEGKHLVFLKIHRVSWFKAESKRLHIVREDNGNVHFGTLENHRFRACLIHDLYIQVGEYDTSIGQTDAIPVDKFKHISMEVITIKDAMSASGFRDIGNIEKVGGHWYATIWGIFPNDDKTEIICLTKKEATAKVKEVWRNRTQLKQ